MTTSDSPLSRVLELGDGWQLWRAVMVRGAGFPTRALLELAAPEAAAAADRMQEHVAAVRAARADALVELEQLRNTASPDRRRLLHKALDLLRRERPLAPSAELDAIAPARAQLQALEVRGGALHAELEAAYRAALTRLAAALRGIAGDPRFREALRWQNPTALETGIDWLLAHPEAVNASARRKHQLVASYLQRYCAKNDTIGFFGPIAWGAFSEDDVVDVIPGPALLKSRHVYLEQWAIDELAAAITRIDGVRPHVAPRLLPSVVVDGTTVRYGFDRETQVPAVVARLLVACDGETPAIEIARRLAATDDVTVEDAYDLLDQLVDKKLVVWVLEPRGLVYPERELRRLLERIEPSELRERCLGILTQLEDARTQVAAAAGDPERLGPALAAVGRVFGELTGLAASRNAGRTYGGRTPLYEDCVRDLGVTLGRPVLDRLRAVLPSVLLSARWFTHTLATRFRAAVHQRFRELRATGPVSYLRLLAALDELLPAERPSPIAVELEAELQQRWAEVIGQELSGPRITVGARDVEERARRVFAAPRPGWPGARHVSPDVLIAAASREAVARGEGTIVLGEVHVGNTLLSRAMIPHGPQADEDVLIADYERDVDQVRVFGTPPGWRINRALATPWAARDLDVETGPSRSWRPRAQVLRVADLAVEEGGADLIIREARTGRTFDLMLFLEAYLYPVALAHFKPVQGRDHVPRVTIDGVVLAREQWRFDPATLGWSAAEEQGATMFAEIRAWARVHALPRWVFVKIPEEPKPMYVDFASPTYVELFARLVRKASRIAVSEMLPTIDEAWLPDAEGHTYTSEFRFVAVDPIAWEPT